jgi:acetyl esterase
VAKLDLRVRLFGRVLRATSGAGTDEARVARAQRQTLKRNWAVDLLLGAFHRGGWTVGTLNQADWLCSNVAAKVGAVVVSVDYRLAPGHRWPAAPEDCYAALVDVAARAAEFGADPQRLAVMGDSAGSNLAGDRPDLVEPVGCGERRGAHPRPGRDHRRP